MPLPTATAPLPALMLACLMLQPAPARAAEAATLKVTFRGIETPAGAIRVVLLASPDAYAGKAAPAGQALLPAAGASVGTSFPSLKPGRYAIKSFHDLDGDGKMKTNRFGAPAEPYAFSNNATGMMGPPSWAAASFEVKPGDNVITIAIR